MWIKSNSGIWMERPYAILYESSLALDKEK